MFEGKTRHDIKIPVEGVDFPTVIQDTLLVLLWIQIPEPYCCMGLLVCIFNQFTFLSFIGGKPESVEGVHPNVAEIRKQIKEHTVS